jgi:hypothetical protein
MKKQISEYINHYITKHISHEDKLSDLSEFIHDFFNNMDDEYLEVKEAFYEALESFTGEIDEDMARAIIENLKKKDGSHSGMKWTVEEVETVCKQYDVRSKVEILGKRYDSVKFWIAMNYVYAVHFSINRSTTGYIDLAIDEMTNKNMCFDELVKNVFRKL